ncbi:8742_t:CDS:2 [Paraglomus occultum]|uniref:8742_t:CDS:1 n=1 Tax=Paraglomus occultum TaxID=144539 RepID=A0A9N8ZW74_9GLOM|nr:8742_t:CDS:2 [Paraglomus occultum]
MDPIKIADQKKQKNPNLTTEQIAQEYEKIQQGEYGLIEGQWRESSLNAVVACILYVGLLVTFVHLE